VVISAGIVTFPAYSKNSTNLLLNGFSASYDVSKDGFHLGVSERQLIKKSKTQYTYQSLTYATGLAGWFFKDKITELSQFTLLKNKLMPTHYEYKNTNNKRKDNFTITFNNKNNTVTRSNDNLKQDIASNKQDLLSFQIAIMQALQNNITNMKFTIIDNKRIAEYALKHTKDETLKLEKSQIETLVLESNVRNNKYHFIFWCAKKYNYFPVKIQRFKKNGDMLLMQLNRINGQKIKFLEQQDEDEDVD
jgi:uncharacterized protein YeaC (DUF1315 family)